MLRTITTVSRTFCVSRACFAVSRSLATTNHPPLIPSTTPKTSITLILTDLLDVVSHVIDRETRTVLPTVDPLDIVLDDSFPVKFNMNTLTQVFESFAKVWKPNDTNVIFNYDGVPWLATIRSHSTSYADRSVKFINIKLPNDSFFYTSQYNNSRVLAESDVTRLFLKQILVTVLRRELLPGTPGRLVVKYSIHRQRLAIYLWNKEESACVTVKYEYGYHEDAQDTQPGHFISLLQEVVDDIEKVKISHNK